jgi:Tfp pilus assembly PilM family ATPase
MKKKSHKSFRVHVRKKAVGIDVCKDSVSVVRLERNGDIITLLGSSRIKIDKGSDDFKSLANAVIKSKLTSYPRHCEAGMCFCSSPELLQIINLPDPSPDAARRFIQEELKQYAVLPLKNVKIDYSYLKNTGSSEQKSVLVGASQVEPLTLVTKELTKKNVDIRAIEPAIIALIRLCYNSIIKSSGKKNVMLVLLHDDNMSLCVFSRQKFDFLRTKKFDFDISSSTEQMGAIAEQIESVVHFYEFERVSEQKEWPVFLASSCELSKAKEIAEELKKHIRHQNIEISAIEARHTDIVCEDAAVDDFSPVAAGMAMKLLDINDSGISINMLPDEISEIRKARNQLVAIANIAAVILLIIFVYIGFLTKKTSNVKDRLSQKTQAPSSIDISLLMRAQADVNDRTREVTRNINTLKNVFKNRVWRNWAFVLGEACAKAPPTIQIQEIRARDLSTIHIKGLAISYNAVNDYVNRLTSCKTISSAQLADAKQNTKYGYGMVDYLVICSLKE